MDFKPVFHEKLKGAHPGCPAYDYYEGKFPSHLRAKVRRQRHARCCEKIVLINRVPIWSSRLKLNLDF